MRISDWSSDVCSSDLHSKAARRQVEQLSVERILPRLAKARAAVDRRARRPVGRGARGGDGEAVATRDDTSFLDLHRLSCRPISPLMVTAVSKPNDRKSASLNLLHQLESTLQTYA